MTSRLGGLLLVAGLSILAWEGASPSVAGAQALATPALTLSAEAQAELAEIDAQASTATILLAIGIPAHVLGLAGTVFGILVGAAAAIGGGGGELIALGLVGAGVALAGLVMLVIGASLDVGSGARRGNWRQRHGVSASVLPTLAPLPDGGTLGLVGAF